MRLSLVVGAALFCCVAIPAASACRLARRQVVPPPPVAAVPDSHIVPVELVPIAGPHEAPVAPARVHPAQTSLSSLGWRVGRVYGPVLIGLALVLALVHRLRSERLER